MDEPFKASENASHRDLSQKKTHNDSPNLSETDTLSSTLKHRRNRGTPKANFRKENESESIESKSEVNGGGGSVKDGDSLHSHYSKIAKSTIEKTLFKSAGVVSAFTENTILATSGLENNHLKADRFVGSNFHKKRTWSANSYERSIIARSKVESKLPSSIVELLRDDSSSSVNSKDKRKYHSKKMALKEGANFSQGNSAPDFKRSNHSKVPKIVVISIPLQLARQNTENRPTSSEIKSAKEITKHTDKSSKSGKESMRHDSLPPPSPTRHTKEEFMNVAAKYEKRIGSPYNNTVKKSHKISIGIEKGVAFVLGKKARQPFLNTFGIAKDFKHDQDPLNRKWVINIGNLQDSEIAFSLFENNLKITGFRQPNLKYPDGQTVTEEVSMPSDLNINHLRVYRSADANEILILEEMQGI